MLLSVLASFGNGCKYSHDGGGGGGGSGGGGGGGGGDYGSGVDVETYVHRVGRATRSETGSGLVINLVSLANGFRQRLWTPRSHRDEPNHRTKTTNNKTQPPQSY
jgi:hypothetical protein